MYNPNNWYWAVNGSTTQVYSSAVGDYVALTDANYIAWLAAGNSATKIVGNDMILIRIELLESIVTDRRIREAVLGTDGGWLANLNAGIVALRAQLVA